MAKKFLPRVKTRTEKDERELRGLWKAIGLVKEAAENKEKLTISLILKIHKTIFVDVYPDTAGQFRRDGEDIKKLKCIEPPPGRLVTKKMHEFWGEVDKRLALIPLKPKSGSKNSRKRWFEEIVDVAVWTQHQIGAIHPFTEGNGRMARLLTNLILQRYGIKPSEVRYEGEARRIYLNALCQADRYADYEPLKELVLKGIREAYLKEKKIRARAVSRKH